MSIPPNQTLYVNSLNDKISKTELKKSLYFLFSVYGRILDIVALKTISARGQAFVVFNDIQDATNAMRSLNGFPMFEKSIKIQYAKSKSKAVKIKDGTLYKKDTAADTISSALKRPANDADEDEDIHDKSRDAHVANPQKKLKSSNEIPSNNLLFLSNLPTSVTEEGLTTLFNKYPGFKEIRLIPGKKEIAFVEYATILEASAAKNVLDSFEMAPGHHINVNFAAK